MMTRATCPWVFLEKRFDAGGTETGYRTQLLDRGVNGSGTTVTCQGQLCQGCTGCRYSGSHPTLRPLFKGDMVVQGSLLMTMIETAVENVHQLDQILPAVRDLGRRHAGYGVKAADYDTVAGALLGTLEQALGSEFTPAVRDAWVAY
jgi:hypothetical protein